MSVISEVRVAGANTRQAMMAIFDRVGDRIGQVYAQRFLWEIAEAAAEVAGRRAASEMVYQVADSIAGRSPLPYQDADTATPEEAEAADEVQAALVTLQTATEALADPPPRRWPVTLGVLLVVFLFGLCIGRSLA